MTILSHNSEFIIINDVPVRKKDVVIRYVDIDRIEFSNVATEDKLMRSELYSAISVDDVFYNKKDDLAVVLANIFTTNGDISFEGIELIKGLKGDKGDTGDAGPQGIQGIAGNNGTNGTNGVDGADGISAYQVALNNGFVGTESAWLLSLKGETGSQGPIGLTGPAGANGTNGADGEVGPQGIQGVQGLKGDAGDQGIQGEIGPQGIQGEVGPQGLKGDQGLPGTNGTLISSGTENPTGGADGDIYLQYII